MMRAVIWITTLAVVAAYGLYAFATLDRRGDREILNSIILDAARAAENRDVGGIMDSVSADYKDPAGLNHDQLRMLAAQAVRVEQKYGVTATVSDLDITGDSATAEVHAVVQVPKGPRILDRKMVVTFTRESARHALVFPTRAWRITSVANHGMNLSGDL